MLWQIHLGQLAKLRQFSARVASSNYQFFCTD